MARKNNVEVFRERTARTFANADERRTYDAVCAALKESLDVKKTICFLDLKAFFVRLKLSNLREAEYLETFADILTYGDVTREYGEWNICEYEYGVYILFQSAAVGAQKSIHAETSHHIPERRPLHAKD